MHCYEISPVVDDLRATKRRSSRLICSNLLKTLQFSRRRLQRQTLLSTLHVVRISEYKCRLYEHPACKVKPCTADSRSAA